MRTRIMGVSFRFARCSYPKTIVRLGYFRTWMLVAVVNQQSELCGFLRLNIDGLLLLAVHGIKSETCIQIMGDTFVSEGTGPLELYKISNEIRNKLYQQCRFLAYPHKIVVTILEGSTVASQVNVLKDYQLDVEVCPVVYSRQYATWAGKTQEFGSLEMKTKD